MMAMRSVADEQARAASTASTIADDRGAELRTEAGADDAGQDRQARPR